MGFDLKKIDSANVDRMLDFYSRYKSQDDSSYDLLAFKVREILLVSSYYDAFIFEQDGLLSEQLIAEFHQLNLSFPPRVTHVVSVEEAGHVLRAKQIDLVILTARIGDVAAAASSIKGICPDIAVLLLVNNLHDLDYFQQDRGRLGVIDDIFFWSGNSNIFLAMIKSVEDRRNLALDTKKGLVRVILVIEDSVRQASTFLPMLYSLIVRQTQQLISEEVSETVRRRRMRMRPKVVLVNDHAEALYIFNEYKDYLIGIITDVAFLRAGVLDPQAGLAFVKTVRASNQTLPVLIQSAEPKNEALAKEIGATFLDKNSPLFLAELKKFIVDQLGFGDFVFRTKDGTELAVAPTMQEFMDCLPVISDESLLFHAAHNHFSGWLIAHGEVEYAKKIQPLVIEDFETTDALRTYLVEGFEKLTLAKNRGRIVVLSNWEQLDRSQVVKISEGSLGAKGRGLAFLNSLIHHLDLGRMFPGITVSLPFTVVIGTQEYDDFLERNAIDSKVASLPDQEIRNRFLAGNLSKRVLEQIWGFCEQVQGPLAIRSSGLLEDNRNAPLAGVYKTFMLPNQSREIVERFDQIVAAIKLVYASVFERTSLDHLISFGDEERMAVVLQELIGVRHDSYFYPDISGVAQSKNYYPSGQLQAEDGVASVALGLGRTVVEGRRTMRFCPKLSQVDLIPQEELIRGSQREFWALDLNSDHYSFLHGEHQTLVSLDLTVAEAHGTLAAVGSVWDAENERLVDSLTSPGLRLVSFSNVLKYGSFPLAKLVDLFLSLGQAALGEPVEIEFAANIKSGAQIGFYPLQIRPLGTDHVSYRKLEPDPGAKPLVSCTNPLGTGVYTDVTDVIFVPKELFDVTKTQEIRKEIAELNDRMKLENRNHILIGPGRWGSRDEMLGIPVTWADISQARAIVEYDTESFQLEASQGSHFLHNIITRNVGYMKISWNKPNNFIDWDLLKLGECIERRNYCRLVRFGGGCTVMTDHGLVLVPKVG